MLVCKYIGSAVVLLDYRAVSTGGGGRVRQRGLDVQIRLQRYHEARAHEGRRSSRLFHFACVFFWQRALTLDFFIEKRCTYAQVSDSRRASPTRRVRIFCIRAAWRVFGGRIRERSPRLSARSIDAPRSAALQHAEVNLAIATPCQTSVTQRRQCSYHTYQWRNKRTFSDELC